MAYHEKFCVPASCEICLCRKENIFFGVLIIRYELWIYGENKTEVSVKFEKSPKFKLK